jgi:O-antigen/teichoic acid export membrane protein
MSSLSPKNSNIVNNIGLSSIYKGIAISISFFLVPLSITYLGSEKYGLWLTIFSFIGWFNFFDFGIGHGLRNKLTEALAHDDSKLARSYISTAYFTMSSIVLLLVIVFIIASPLIPWDSMFKVQSVGESVEQLITIVFVIFFTNLILKMATAIFFAEQKSSVPTLINLIGQIIIFICIYIATISTDSSIVLYGVIVSGGPFLVLLCVNLILFSSKYKYLRPSFTAFEWKHSYEIFSLGGKFFFIQIAAVLIYSTDNFIINYFLGAEQVTVYNVAFKYFMFATMAMNIVLEPFWSAFTEAQSKNEKKWMKISIINLLKISALASLVVIVMIFIADNFYLLWVGESIQVPIMLTIFMGINTIQQLFMQPLVMFINGVGKIKLQLIIGMIAATVNIPLSIFLAVHLEFGVSGVILATIITRIFGLFIYPLQVIKIINGNAKNIWNS